MSIVLSKGFINYHNVDIKYIVESFDVKKPQNHTTSPFVGRNSSTTKFVSSDGRILSFRSLCLSDEIANYKGRRVPRIKLYKHLANTYNQKPAVLSSYSKSDIDGNYIITGFDYREDTSGNFEINWEFTEVAKFNRTQKTFRIWNKAQLTEKNKGHGKGKVKTKALKVDSNTKKLLKDCGVLKRNDKKHGIKCVRILQRFLQKNGYYKNYKVDGWYSKYTFQAVKSLQKAKKLKSTGNWNKETRKYFQKKYNYPPRVEAIPTLLRGNKTMKGPYVVD